MTAPARPVRIGLLINPVAGLGGSAGLKGSDGADIQREARRRGAVPLSTGRALRTLSEASRLGVEIELVTGSGALGESAVCGAGLVPAAVVPPFCGDTTTAADTTAAAGALAGLDLDVLVFAGGDGTARDVAAGIGSGVVVLGIPAGVKMQSGVFARSPESAAAALAAFARGNSVTTEAEVADIDEEARRHGIISSSVYGRMTVLGTRLQVQGGKLGSREEPRDVLNGIVKECVERIHPDAMCLLGPGTTIAAVARGLEVESSLMGVDVLHRGALVATDCSAAELHAVTNKHKLQIVLSPIGGQGFLLGRGNQQLDTGVLSRIRPEDCMIVCSPEKLGGLGGGPFYVDVGDPGVLAGFSGPHRVITGYRQEAVVLLKSA